MDKISKEQMKAFHKDINTALLAVAQKHGMTSLEAVKGKFTPEKGNFSFTLQGVVAGGLDERAARYVEAAKLFGWPDIFAEFEYRGKDYKIIGCNTTGSKIFCQTGTATYEFPPALVKQIFQVKTLKAAAAEIRK